MAIKKRTVNRSVKTLIDYGGDNVKSNSVALILAHWQICDNIDIPDEIVETILRKATPPESITRSKRRALSAAS